MSFQVRPAPRSSSDVAVAGPPPAVGSTGGMWRMLSTPPQQKLPKGLDAIWDMMVGHSVGLRRGLRTSHVLRRAEAIIDRQVKYSDLSSPQLRERAQELRVIFRRGRETADHVDEAFALLREVVLREKGFKLHREQIAGGLAMDRGHIAEMATGEGKTVTATLPATLAGWRGRGCHVLTVNDYLAKRDAELLESIYKFVGLKVAYIDGEMERPQRKLAYAADVTYCTNKESCADFLRDRLRLGQVRSLPAALLSKLLAGRSSGVVDDLLMRGLECAIVDEADSILIDEAVTPLIISGDAPNKEQVDTFAQAADVAKRMELGTHYTVNHRYREVEITDFGRDWLKREMEHHGGIWAGARRREEVVNQALTARDVFLRDKQYVIQEGKIVIVDEFTGRLMPDRTWRNGLHQAIEAKEGVEINAPKETFARVSFQRFFRSYKKLCGMTGTAAESSLELWQVYKLPVTLIPTHKPCIRVRQPDRVYLHADEKWDAIVDEIAKVHATGRPILVGTRSVEASEKLSLRLTELQLVHQVLNATRHAEEAAIVAGAGQRGCITVATNMAGRGTDIKLGPGVAELGGLHVIATERHESGRVDRQLFGRSGRQGDPGSAVAIVCLEDELIQRYGPIWSRRMPRIRKGKRGDVSGPMMRHAFERAQARAQSIARRQRRGVAKTDDWLDETLGFAGREI